MGPQALVIAGGVMLFAVVVYMMLKKKSNEGNSLVWLMASVVLILVGIFPGILDTLCGWLNVDYPPTLAMMIAILFLVVFVFNLSIQLSVAKSKINELSIQISLLNNDVVRFKKILQDQDQK